MKKFPELIPITTCHSYEIFSKYTYKCTKCGQGYVISYYIISQFKKNILFWCKEYHNNYIKIVKFNHIVYQNGKIFTLAHIL